MKTDTLLLIGIPAILFGVAQMSKPLGMRNNNPFNIKYNPANDWVGQTGQAGPFAKFDTMVHGIRAGFKLLNTYKTKYGLKTPLEITSRYAPTHPEEPSNDHLAYAQFIAGRLNVGINDTIPNSKWFKLGETITHYENGGKVPSHAEMLKGFELSQG